MNLQTERLHIRKFTLQDASFFFELVNDPDWKRFIGERNVQTLKDAEDYLTNRIMKSYEAYGFGFYIVIEKSTGDAVGMAGFVKREELDFVDVGFAFLPIGRGKGYAYEATQVVMDFGKKTFDFDTVLGIANNDNIRSHQLLEKLGLRFDKYVKLFDENQEISLFTTSPPKK